MNAILLGDLIGGLQTFNDLNGHLGFSHTSKNLTITFFMSCLFSLRQALA
jgi:hypothetical protein